MHAGLQSTAQDPVGLPSYYARLNGHAASSVSMESNWNFPGEPLSGHHSVAKARQHIDEDVLTFGDGGAASLQSSLTLLVDGMHLLQACAGMAAPWTLQVRSTVQLRLRSAADAGSRKLRVNVPLLLRWQSTAC